MKELFVGILASVIAGILLIVTGSFLSKSARWVLTATLGRLLEIDTEFVFRNQADAEEDIRKELARASKVDLLTSRGNELQRGTLTDFLHDKPKGFKPQFRLLLPVARSKGEGPDWTAQRDREVGTFDSNFGKGLLRDQIETTVKSLGSFVENGLIELRFYNYPHIGRILVTDHVAYFTPYRKDAHGKDCNVIKYRRGGNTYESLSRLFELLWDEGSVSSKDAEQGIEKQRHTVSDSCT